MEKSNETKQKLLEAACTVFREKNYEKAKVSDIVACANVAQGTFYLYFKSKKDCLNTLMIELISSFLDEIKEEAENLEHDSIYRVVDKILTSIDAHSEILNIMHFEQRNMDDEVVEMHVRVHRESTELINRALLKRGFSEKSAQIKTKLIDALIKQYLLSHVYLINPLLKDEFGDLDGMVQIVIDEVNC